MKSSVVFFAFVLTITGWAQSQLPTPIPLDFFGIHMNEGPSSFTTTALPPIVIGSGGKGAATNWPYLETARGTYNWEALDSVAAFNQTTGKPVFEGYQEQPLWAVSETTACYAATLGIDSCPAAPSDLFTVASCQGPLADTTTTDCMFKEYITSMVKRYNHSGTQTGCTTSNPQCHGVFDFYEFWNEPPYSIGPVSGCPVASTCMPIASFVQMASDWYYTIKALDSQAKVCSPSFLPSSAGSGASTFISTFLANGGAAIPFDCWDFHINETVPEAQIADITTFTGILSANGISNPLLYATEAGRWEVGNCDAIDAADEQAYVGRIELIYWSNDVKRHYWYAYSTCAPLSNQPTASTLTSLGIAYGNVESWMVGATMTSPCTLSNSFWTCGLTLANGHQALAVWYNVFQSAATTNYTPASQYTHWYGLNGKTGAVGGSVTVGESPILLEAGSSSSAPDFSLSVGSSSMTVTQGGQATNTVTVTPHNGAFTNVIAFSCSAEPEATCTLSPQSVTPGSTPATSTLTISTQASSADGSFSFTITGTSGTLVHTTTVSLTVTAAPPFALTATPLTPATITPGDSATSTVTITPSGGFNSTVNLTCAITPATSVPPTCSFGSASVSGGSGTSTLTVKTVAALAALRPNRLGGMFYATLLPLCGLTLMGARFTSSSRRLLGLLLVCLMLSGLIFQAACGGSGTNPSPNLATQGGTYSIAIVATSGTIQHSTNITLTVQ